VRGFAGRRKRTTAAAPRVGLFGLLGTGNIGNDASMEAVLQYLRTDHPDAILDAMCKGPERMREHYGIEAIPLYWHQRYEQRTSGVTAIAVRVLGKGLDAFRTAWWVRRHDVVIVPGMGVLEATTPLRPWQTPYAMFLLCIFGKVFGTKVALVSVGANVMKQRLTRWLFDSAARLAFYRSYRDVASREAMRRRGLDITHDRIYPDLVFGLPAPPDDLDDARTVAVGVMAYYGSNDDRGQADEIYASYVEKISSFIRWLVDNGHKVRVLVGDAGDDHALQDVLANIRAQRPDLDPGWVAAEPATSFAELTRAMAPAGIVVATRYHNVICALKLSKPTISIGYAGKNMAVMADAGLSEFCQFTSSLDVGLLIKQFTELENRSAQLRRMITERNMVNAQFLDEQFAALSALLFPTGKPARPTAEHEPVRTQ
jgi:polysaccharide pyruvyl transferase WcaK-like protein